MTAAVTSSRPHFPCFDGLRAIAALTVLLHHAGFVTGASWQGGVGPYLARMDSGVTIFFVISGFLLYRPYVDAHLTGERALSVGRFYTRRVLRIFPAYWVALTGVVLFFGTQVSGWGDIVTFYGLFQIYDDERFFGALSQAWSLSTELSFYLVLPAYAWLVRRLAGPAGDRARVVRVEVLALAVVVAASLLWRSMLHPVDGSELRQLARYWLPAHADLFAVGMLMAVASVALAGRDERPTVTRTHLLPLASWALAFAALWAVSHRVDLPLGLADGTESQEWARHLLYLAYAALLVLPAVFGPREAGAVRRLLASPPMLGLGLVSYGVYLWHQAWLGKVMEWTDSTLFDADVWQVAGFAVVPTVLTATLSYRIVERPFLRLKTRDLRRPTRDRLRPAELGDAVAATQPAP